MASSRFCLKAREAASDATYKNGRNREIIDAFCTRIRRYIRIHPTLFPKATLSMEIERHPPLPTQLDAPQTRRTLPKVFGTYKSINLPQGGSQKLVTSRVK